ncbi:MAG: rhomboid family intramembrane serine protease [Flavobacterium sp.]|uniref:rhomboid family intramembrane serine protease n=1 Tax=Flavobacterium sp. TaxID=239 RepID=UPI001B5465BE|nr:rhomboid family intramembrane serine protease [Flavobacterium sp.]MBP9849917.1 rhomboid family intramembrane serine protease [Flavobacterium sp.]WRH72803.1 MAG: rhomboid family intramembrane serine protease [Flavobacterium sp.]
MKKQHDNPFQFTKAVIFLPLFFVMTLWSVFWYELQFQDNLSHFGIYPREVYGLKGILFSPFLHGDIEHLANNSFALLVLLPILRYFYKEQSFVVLLFGIIFSGLGTWLLGRPSYHIGASGLIYALVSFIFFKGIFTKYYRLVALSFTIVILYGGSVWYMFPNVKEGISWEGHLAGFIVGLALALVLKTPQFSKPIFYEWEKPDFNPELDPFMKNFDEKGNFNPPPKPEEVIREYFNSSMKVVYEFLGGKK